MEDNKSKGLTCAEADVEALMECVKQQPDNIPAVKSALLSIVSVCQENSNAGVYFHDIGGLKLVRDLARSEAPSKLKEVTLYTLGTLAISNVVCQQSLCTPELFEEMLMLIIDEQSSMDLQTVSVSVLLGLVSKNSSGQMLLRETGCIAVLQKLFRETFTNSEIDSSNESFKEKYPLWHALCNTLIAAVNNPKNEENQRICCSVLPHVHTLLEAHKTPELVGPICLLIGLIVDGNSPVQEFLISIGGLDVLTKVFTELVEDSRQNLSSAKMAVEVTSAMGNCIAQNSPGSTVLAKHQVVPKLLNLLFLENLDSQDRTSVLVTLGHCIQTCDQNLDLLLQNDGLKRIKDAFSESHNEIVSAIVSFVRISRDIWDQPENP
ncbi:telomere repeats-binding bouquet formation protein 1-like [Ornithorhynchus anatinus]|uniref:telomere repeats-binding bouquet formation protein 1-like n=1 Tax=Ornithorhynchus anatinus TaxID=9258 RepID=UPI0010A77126|nr:telomere repeats-binding bouquet formation protein 1-like [Ornithorhynchus anatinus]